MNWKRIGLLLSLCLCLVLIANIAQTSLGFGSDTSWFIVFSDAHIGAGYGSDGMNATQRLIALLKDSNRYGNQTKINLGDLTGDGYYSQYDQYSAVTYGKGVLEVKGNHDQNSKAFLQKIGKMNWVYRYGDILFVGVSCLANTLDEWLNRGISYNASTYDFLNSVVKSSDYFQTKYHFLFMHFAVDSTWPTNALHGVSSKFSTFVKYFTIAFCGHEGGGSWNRLWDNKTPCIKASHLGDSRSSTDEYFAVRLIRSANQIEIYRRNFATNQTGLFCRVTP